MIQCSLVQDILIYRLHWKRVYIIYHNLGCTPNRLLKVHFFTVTLNITGEKSKTSFDSRTLRPTNLFLFDTYSFQFVGNGVYVHKRKLN